MSQHRAFIEYDGGLIDVNAVHQISYSTAQGGTVSVAQHLDGSSGHVVAQLEKIDSTAAPKLLDDEETKALAEKLRAVAASLTVALASSTAPAEGETEETHRPSVRFVMFDQARLYWEIKPALETPGVDQTIRVAE